MPLGCDDILGVWWTSVVGLGLFTSSKQNHVDTWREVPWVGIGLEVLQVVQTSDDIWGCCPMEFLKSASLGVIGVLVSG